ncbi:DUF3592 domain-containing protein [Calidithermus chliarophilus]|uniref:DUF3592 domain-containing protein n=1 Tax=Calidithermus chliarophilus TaxID=52023 RepID=UPI000426DC53|nr:DUF3592 domain-containing protein [Calidithermus chliarophilus]
MLSEAEKARLRWYLMAFGAVVCWLLMGYSAWKHLDRRDWHSTVGEVVAREDCGRNCIARLTYLYTVGGRTRLGRFSETPSHRSQELGGGRVTVYYDPERPERSTLSRDLPGNWGWGLAFLAFCTLYEWAQFRVATGAGLGPLEPLRQRVWRRLGL